MKAPRRRAVTGGTGPRRGRSRRRGGGGDHEGATATVTHRSDVLSGQLHGAYVRRHQSSAISCLHAAAAAAAGNYCCSNNSPRPPAEQNFTDLFSRGRQLSSSVRNP